MKNIRGYKRLGKRFTAFSLVAMLMTLTLLPVYGETLSEIQRKKQEAEQQKQNMQSQLNSVQSEIDSMEESMESMEEEIEEIDSELIDVILSIDVLTDDIDSKKSEIDTAQQEYELAQETEANQYEAMKRRIKFMYEKGDESYLSVLLESKSMAEAVNKRSYSNKLYAFDRQLLEEYQQSKQDVLDKKEALETELSELEEIEQDLEEQKVSLQSMIIERREILEDFDEKLSAAHSKADEYKNQIKAQASEIKKIEQQEAQKKAEEEAKRRAEEAARKRAEAEAKRKAEEASKRNNAKANESSDDSSDGGSTSEPETYREPASPGDSSKGQEIANFACQFVGGPYVPGGTSLTEGCDCSGFTSSVYAHFGISLPRSSYAQSTVGREVSYAEAQPGDIMYYGGHVAIYIGNNTIVHASTQATGIKYSNASYRTVITIRRLV